jgi:hypothetical protein
MLDSIICNFFPLTSYSYTLPWIDDEPYSLADLELLTSEGTVTYIYTQRDSGLEMVGQRRGRLL